VRKGERELSSVTRYLPTGIDVRLLEGEDFRRTKLCRDALAVESLADAWRAALIDRGWLPTQIRTTFLRYLVLAVMVCSARPDSC